jgi:hypothetical protein
MKNEQSNLQTVFTAVASILAGRYDMPELNAVEPVLVTDFDSEAATPNALRAEFSVAPRGQIAAIVTRLVCSLTVIEGNGFTARLKMNYNHIGGGSNGKDTDFVVVLRKDWCDKTVAVEDVVTQQAHYIITQEHAARVRAELKGKTAEELFAIFNK